MPRSIWMANLLHLQPTTDHFQAVTNWNLAIVGLLDAYRIACGYPTPIADIRGVGRPSRSGTIPRRERCHQVTVER